MSWLLTQSSAKLRKHNKNVDINIQPYSEQCPLQAKNIWVDNYASARLSGDKNRRFSIRFCNKSSIYSFRDGLDKNYFELVFQDLCYEILLTLAEKIKLIANETKWICYKLKLCANDKVVNVNHLNWLSSSCSSTCVVVQSANSVCFFELTFKLD